MIDELQEEVKVETEIVSDIPVDPEMIENQPVYIPSTEENLETLNEAERLIEKFPFLEFLEKCYSLYQNSEIEQLVKLIEDYKLEDLRKGYIEVYESNGFYRISKSKNPEKIAILESKDNPVPLKYVAKILVPDCIESELKIHRMFQDRRLHENWFNLSEEQLGELINELTIVLK